MIEFIEVFSRLFLKIGPSRTIIMCNFQTLGKVYMESYMESLYGVVSVFILSNSSVILTG